MAATILTVQDLAKRFATEVIFSGVSFSVAAGERVALVGANGAGKSTVLRILAGIDRADGGGVVPARDLRVTYLPQEAQFESDLTVRAETATAFAALLEQRQRLEALAEHMSAVTGAALDAALQEYERESTRFEAAGGYEIDQRVAQILTGLGFAPEDLDHAVQRLSGGQKTRVALAKALLAEPDLLLLDEPTNHLDLAALEWLETFLRSWRGAVLVVSHDRYFLDQTTTRTLDLAFGHLEDYPAPYKRFLDLREERNARRVAEWEAQQEFIARTEEFIRKYKAGQRSREAKGRETRLARLERIERPREASRLKLALQTDLRSGRAVLATSPLEIGYSGTQGPRCLVSTEELEILRGARVGLLGPNGSGKSTLLRTLTGELPTLAGTFQFGVNVRPAYYAQGHEALDFERDVLATVLNAKPMSEEQARTYLGRFLFEGDDVYKRVGVLSGGERSRLALAVLTLSGANFLILDEPTNHLDVTAREALEDVLDGFNGTILFVSHDRYFIDRLATEVWVIDDGKLSLHPGNYTAWMGGKSKKSAAVSPPAVAVPATPTAPMPATSLPPRTAVERRSAQRDTDRQLRDRQRRLAALEREIDALETQLADLSHRLGVATADQNVPVLSRLGAEYQATQERLDSTYAEWSRLGEELMAREASG